MIALPPVPLPARTGVSALAGTSVAAASRAAARLAGRPESPVDPLRVAVAFTSERWLRVEGTTPTAFAPLSGFFRAADGWVRTHGNYPHHAEALSAGLGLPEGAGRDDVARALRALPASVASERVMRAGGLCMAVAPESPGVDAELRAAPLVATTRIGQAPPVPLRPSPAHAPLRGIRVLDLTRVIAGPVATRTLALLGADVLRVDSPRLPELPWQHLDTGHGKRSTLLNLRAPADRSTFTALLATTDVVMLGYRPDGLARLGLAPADLADQRPGIVVGRLSAWGAPDRRGFDSLVQAASGIALLESADGTTPGALPAQALDHSAGYLLAAQTMALLQRRADEGGSWTAETSLRRVAAELLGLPRSAQPAVFEPIDATGHCQEFAVDGVEVTTAAPAIAYDGGPAAFAPPRPWGRDRPEWLPRDGD
ncbi:MAG: carnitine dehydratase [Comamonadaceae bacterium]|nr:MAG: carnitine dehydratase [Comamonadaceae bacterium]